MRIQVKLLWIIVMCVLCITSCNTDPLKFKEVQDESLSNIPIREYSVGNVLWQQNAAERRALFYQAYNIARIYLDNVLATGFKSPKPYAIVTDLDETVIDNSYYNAKLIQTDADYSQDTWEDWVCLTKAKVFDGAEAFFNYAESKGVEIFYVSNRLDSSYDSTFSNLRQFDLPYLDREHILLKTTSNRKVLTRVKTVTTQG